MQEKSGDLNLTIYGVIYNQLVHLAMMAKALKRSKNMLSRKELEEIIKAWPDENGISSNPEIFHNWIEIERDHCRTRIRYALGYDRIEALSERQ